MLSFALEAGTRKSLIMTTTDNKMEKASNAQKEVAGREGSYAPKNILVTGGAGFM